MEKYLYLTHSSWSDAWLYGGKVPLYQSSKYLSEERHATFTPDENLIDKSTHDIEEFQGFINISGDCTLFIDEHTTFDEKSYAGGVHIDRRYEDGLVLCMANRRSNYIAKKLGKMACVKIIDLEKLKSVLDQQIGMIGEMGYCTYVANHERGHFLKSSKDAWQDEFRIFWPGAKSQEVIIPPGTAVKISIRGS